MCACDGANYNRRVGRPIIIVAIMLLFGAGAGEMFANPQYTTWAKHKPGTSITLRTTTTTTPARDVGFFTVNVDLIETLVEVTRERAVIDLQTKSDALGPALAEQSRKIMIEAKVPKADLERAQLPGGVTGEIEQAGNETLAVLGKQYKCKVYDFTAEQDGTKFKGRMWRSDDVPGGVVKADIAFEGKQSGTMTLQLVSISMK